MSQVPYKFVGPLPAYVAADTPLVAGDTLLTAMGKLQGQINKDRRVYRITSPTDLLSMQYDYPALAILQRPDMGPGVYDFYFNDGAGPNAFDFTDISSVARSSVQSSNTFTVSGLYTGTSVAISIVNGQYNKNGGAFTSAAGTVVNGDVIQLRVTASSSSLTNVVCSVTIGDLTDTCTVSTTNEPDAFTFAPITGQSRNATSNSNSITVSGLSGSAAISITGGLYNKNGGAFTAVAGTVQNGDVVIAQVTNGATGLVATTCTVTIGTGITKNSTFSSTTKDALLIMDASAGTDLVSATQFFQQGMAWNIARSGTKLRMNSSGVLVTSPINTVELDYSFSLSKPCFLIEENRTNISLWCRDLTNVVWAASGITPAKDQTGMDAGANKASSLTATGALGTIMQTRTAAATTRAYSAYVKRITGTGLIEMTQDGGTTWTAITLTSNFKRFTVKQNVANPQFGFRMTTSGDKIAVDYTQLESTSSRNNAASSPIETTTGSVTRPADIVSITPFPGASVYYSFIGMHADYAGPPATSLYFYEISDGGSSNQNAVRDGWSSGANPRSIVQNAGVNVSTLQSSTPLVADTFNKIASRNNTNDHALSINGNTATTTVGSGSLPAAAITTLDMNSQLGGLPASAPLFYLEIGDVIKTNTQLVAYSGS